MSCERPPCSFWKEERCALGLYGGAPSPGTCRRCDRYEGPPRGLGDVVHTVAEATGVAAVVRLTVGECEGCRRRRREWNGELVIRSD